eukprot:GHVO01043890.1.p2 GENE.GHVO01043890.1~~GHVO01043890.1.p2  ORF type:complete len:161 (+),score=15.95 GHVO01043890.1:1204-1686(+)
MVSLRLSPHPSSVVSWDEELLVVEDVDVLIIGAPSLRKLRARLDLENGSMLIQSAIGSDSITLTVGLKHRSESETLGHTNVSTVAVASYEQNLLSPLTVEEHGTLEASLNPNLTTEEQHLKVIWGFMAVAKIGTMCTRTIPDKHEWTAVYSSGASTFNLG